MTELDPRFEKRKLAIPEVLEPIDRFLQLIHKQNAKKNIEIPDANGTFPQIARFLYLSGIIKPIVVDANYLRSDILRACRQELPTMLINGANNGLFRLFCAEHVVEEVYEHGNDWCKEWSEKKKIKISKDQFFDKWSTDYLPLIRVVKNCGQLKKLLDDDERARLSLLEVLDNDDVPSVCLSLVIQAFFLSRDNNALRAVYGDNFHVPLDGELLQLVKAGSNVAQLEQLISLEGIVSESAISGIVSLIRKAIKNVDPMILLLMVPIAVLGYRWLSRRFLVDTKESIKQTIGEIVNLTMELMQAYLHYDQRFQKVTPLISSWGSFPESIGSRSALTRACLHVLAREPKGHLSARELSEELPYLGTGQGEKLVRETLRASGFFTELSSGRWQIGVYYKTMGTL